ncbi:YjjG family noncanonical pyrimidine nucleotidase [Winogradskyella sp. DF17]|uniref:YjjG family noncanonical pyrimidine nucleotidase n=1 Tax=Winogradskyella pelagia TaxID=2819984 RepID=A0ABS3T3E0_9FLAO|nr:YjjG family noncanonical pyrimidine nucleotidase [Winogradskyella sp. DF17]MBO3117261.1 YjjG family noncanonical pyrimidine nucleotidase [Winogradskyella sp. DF17]
MTNGIKHIFFDLDHTLWDFDKNSRLTFERIFNLHGLPVELNTFIQVYEPINLNYWKLYREERVSKADLRYGRLREAFDTINVKVEDEMINKLSVSYIDYLTTFNHLFEGTREVLNYLFDKYELHIITNGFEEAQERKLQNAEIRQYFNTVTNSEMVGVKKPNPKIFNFALHQAKAEAEESIMIGDSLEADIEGANKVGIEGILFCSHNHYSSANVKKINQLIELKNYL